MSDVFGIYSREEAEGTILKRIPLDEFEVTEGLQKSIEEIFGKPLTPEQAVKRIIVDVRQRGDAALFEWTERIDKVELRDLTVPYDDILYATEDIPLEVFDALKLSARRIEDFHRRQPITSWMNPTEEGMLGQLVTPIEHVGVYVPGGTAPLPSSLLMSAIPAKVAGVQEIVVCTPPGSGEVPAVVLAAAQVAGIEKMYRLGGVMAIAAMAYGTESVSKVDKIVGPGNLFVTLAKREVFGAVGIDGLYGPTETMVIADEDADPAFIAADLLAQAEHDVLASAIVVTPSTELAKKVVTEVERQLEELSRNEIAEEALKHRGGAVIVADLDEAFEVANVYAVEHLQLSVKDPFAWLGKVKNAGAVFLGEHSFEVLGDYVAGPSHSLPTSGTARYASGINVLDFVKITGVIGLEPQAASELSKPASVFADAESLTAHAAAARKRIPPE